MPTARSGLGAAAVNGKIYAIGGAGPGGFLDVVEEYDPRTDSWRQRAPMPTPRSGLAVVAFQGRVYAIGGRNGSTILDVVEVYDPKTDSWACVDPLPVASAELRAAVVKGRIYAIGGFDGTVVIGPVQRYDPKAGVWALLSPMPTPKAAFAIGAVERRIFAIFGESRESPAGGGPFDVYDASADAWEPTVLLGTDILFPMGAVFKDKVYVIGGEFTPGPDTLDDNLEFDPATNSFVSRAPMPTARFHGATAVLGGEIYVLGGSQLPAGTLDTVEAYTPPRRSWKHSDSEWSTADP